MNIESGDIENINQIIKPILGHKAWNVKLGVGSFVTMEFGHPTRMINGKSHGEWYLWIYCCGWYLEKPKGDYLGCEDPREIVKQEISVIEGHQLEDVQISSLAFETNFIFDDDIVLHTFPLNFIDDCEYWMLYTPEGKVLVIGPADKWTYKLSSESRLSE